MSVLGSYSTIAVRDLQPAVSGVGSGGAFTRLLSRTLVIGSPCSAATAAVAELGPVCHSQVGSCHSVQFGQVQVTTADRLLALLFVSLLVGAFAISSYRHGRTTAQVPSAKEMVFVAGSIADEPKATVSAKVADPVLARHLAELIGRIDSRISLAERIALSRIIVKESQLAGYDPLFIAAVINAESTFKRTALSNKGAKGLMQIMPQTGRYISEKRQLGWVGAHKLSEPEYNVRVGIAYLKYLEDSFAFNREQLLIAYNWGPGNLSLSLRRGGSVPKVSRLYASKVLSTHKQWRNDLRLRLARATDAAKSTSALG